MSRGNVSLIVVCCLCAAPLAASGQEKKVEAPKSATPTAEQIDRWVRQLDDDRFGVREQATAALSKAGRAAIAPLVKAAAGSGLEVIVRAVKILTELGLSPDHVTADAARAGLESLVKPGMAATSERAAEALTILNAREAKLARVRIFKLGAVRGTGSNVLTPGLSPRDSHLMLQKKNWKGKEADLKLLKWLTDVNHLSIHGCHLGDAGVAQLKKLKHLRKLELYGTRISQETLKEITAALPAAEIDFRLGALLGVTGSALGKTCQLDRVTSGSAADKAGLRVGDRIIKCDDKDVADFKDLTAIIGAHQGGDKLKMKILRGATEKEVEVTLGEWGE